MDRDRYYAFANEVARLIETSGEASLTEDVRSSVGKLADLNRAGIITLDSQGGETGVPDYFQRPYLEFMVESSRAKSFLHAFNTRFPSSSCIAMCDEFDAVPLQWGGSSVKYINLKTKGGFDTDNFHGGLGYFFGGEEDDDGNIDDAAFEAFHDGYRERFPAPSREFYVHCNALDTRSVGGSLDDLVDQALRSLEIMQPIEHDVALLEDYQQDSDGVSTRAFVRIAGAPKGFANAFNVLFQNTTSLAIPSYSTRRHIEVTYYGAGVDFYVDTALPLDDGPDDVWVFDPVVTDRGDHLIRIQRQIHYCMKFNAAMRKVELVPGTRVKR